jgi:hypothetical protein
LIHSYEHLCRVLTSVNVVCSMLWKESEEVPLKDDEEFFSPLKGTCAVLNVSVLLKSFCRKRGFFECRTRVRLGFVLPPFFFDGALDSWAFRISDFAEIFATKLKMNLETVKSQFSLSCFT